MTSVVCCREMTVMATIILSQPLNNTQIRYVCWYWVRNCNELLAHDLSCIGYFALYIKAMAFELLIKINYLCSKIAWALAVKLLLGACHRKASIRTRIRLLYVGFGERNRYITQKRTAGDMKKYRTRTNDGVHNTHATNHSSILIMPKYVTLCFITFCYVHTSMEVISSPCYVVLASAYAYMIYLIHIYKRNLKHPQSSYTPESPISIVVNTHCDRNFEIPPNILTSVTWSVIERW